MSLIRIHRNSVTIENRSLAIARLNEIEHKVGQPVMTKYTTDTGKEDTILSIGIKDGTGSDCYKVISLGGLELVHNVVTELPSELNPGEVFLLQNSSSGKWTYIYVESKNSAKPSAMPSVDTTFVSINDNYRWFWKDGNLRREDDSLSEKEFVNEIKLTLGPPKLTVNCEEGYLFLSGEKTDLNIHVKVENALGDDLTDICKFFIDGKEVTKSGDNKITVTDVSDTHNFTIKAVASPKEGSEYTYTSNLLIEFGYYFYYGVVENNWELLGDNVKKLENLKLSTRKNIEFDNITLNQQGLVFSYPTIYGTLEHIYDRHGLDYIDDYTKYEVLVDGVNYFVYFNKNSLIISNYSQTFSFGIENNSVGDDNKDINQHSSLIDAWVDKNSPGGLVQIEGTGKIPSHLLPNYEIESEYSFIKINKFVTTFPSKNLTVGDRWYSTIDKKIFTATSTTQGVISDPQENTIYINTSENTFYIWESDIEDMVLFGGLNSTKIIDVTEIL